MKVVVWSIRVYRHIDIYEYIRTEKVHRQKQNI